MIFKNKNYVFIIFFIIIIQILLFLNNSQRTSIRYLVWSLQDISIGKLINISFFSGLMVSTLLVNAKNSTSNYKSDVNDEKELRLDPQIREENNELNIEMPPQRDIRDAQPTISVNYRVIKNSKERNQQYEENFSNDSNMEMIGLTMKKIGKNMDFLNHIIKVIIIYNKKNT